MSEDVTSMKPEDLVACLHPSSLPSRQHTLAAASQIRHLLRYLAAAAHPAAAGQAYPDPLVTKEMAIALGDGMRSAAQLSDLLAEHQNPLAGRPQPNTAGGDTNPRGDAEQAARAPFLRSWHTSWRAVHSYRVPRSKAQ